MSAVLPNQNALAQLSRRYANLEERSRFGLRIARDENAESYVSFVIGVVNEKRSLILAAPKDKAGQLVPMAQDEEWLCRLFNATTVYRFVAKVLKVASEPVPYLHIELPKSIEKRMVRKQPRALTSLNATIHKSAGERGVIVDMSVSGVRIALSSSVRLAKGTLVQLFTSIPMLDRSFRLSLATKVSAAYGATDHDFPDINFYGLQFEEINETAILVLNGYVYSQLTDELDRLSRVLAIEEVSASSGT